MDLKELQTMFSSLVTGQNEQNYSKDQLVKIITGGGTLNPDGAINVYSQDYQARMRDALSKNYESTWLIMGDDEFFEYADIYIRTYPSHLSNLTNYGEKFPELLAGNTELIDASKMAIFERAFWRAFHLDDRPPITIDEEMITNGEFNLSGFTFVESEMRLDLVWSHREEGSSAIESLELFEQSYFLIYKANDLVEIRKVREDMYDFLIKLRDCKKIADVKDREVLPMMWGEIFSILKFS